MQVNDFFLAGGGNQSSPLRRQIALSEPISFGEASKLPKQIQSAQLCTHPFIFHYSVSGYISGGRCDHRPCTRPMTTSFDLRRSWWTNAPMVWRSACTSAVSLSSRDTAGTAWNVSVVSGGDVDTRQSRESNAAALHLPFFQLFLPCCRCFH